MSWKDTQSGAEFEGIKKLDDGTEIKVTARAIVRTDLTIEIQFYVAAWWAVTGREHCESLAIEESGHVVANAETWKATAERTTSHAATRVFERLQAARNVAT